MRTLNFAIIGTGSMAASMMEAFRFAPMCEVIAVHSNSGTRAQTFADIYGLQSAYSDLDELFANQDVEAVYIANASGQHASTAVSALNAGKSVLCEKPCAMTFEEFQEIRNAADASGRLFMEGIWTLLLPAYQQFFQYQQQEVFGPARQLTASFGYPVTEASSPQLFERDSGGVINDRLVYLLALAILIMGEPQAASSVIKCNGKGIDTDCNVLLEHANGSCSTLATSFDALLPNDVILACRRGSLKLLPPSLGSETLVLESAHIVSAAKRDRLQEQKSASTMARLKSLPLLRQIKSLKTRVSGQQLSYGRNQYLPQLLHFSELVSSGKLGSPIVSLDLSEKVIKWSDRIKEQI